MNDKPSDATRKRATLVVAAATLIALAVPTASPLYASIYPDQDAKTVSQALAKAKLELGPREFTQFETTEFTATIIYGTASDSEQNLPDVTIAWGNKAALTASDPDAFDIQLTSSDRQEADRSHARPEGGYVMRWTWDVTPHKVGNQVLTVNIIPIVIIDGQTQSEKTASRNDPYAVTVKVHPAAKEFDEVVAAAGDMKTHVPADMVVGQQYDVSASMSLAGHADTVNADIQLSEAGDAKRVVIQAASASGPSESGAQLASTHTAQAGPSGVEQLARHWTVTIVEPGPIDLIFTAMLDGHAGTQQLQRAIPKQVSARAVGPPPSFWDVIQQPVLYIAPFVALAGAILGLWTAWKKRRDGGKSTGGPSTASGSGDPRS